MLVNSRCEASKYLSLNISKTNGIFKRRSERLDKPVKTGLLPSTANTGPLLWFPPDFALVATGLLALLWNLCSQVLLSCG